LPIRSSAVDTTSTSSAIISEAVDVRASTQASDVAAPGAATARALGLANALERLSSANRIRPAAPVIRIMELSFGMNACAP
jgi:hypothetical protein